MEEAEPPGATRRRLGGEHGEDGEHRPSPTLRTAAHLTPVGRPFAWTNEILPLRYGLQWGLLEFTARRSAAEHHLMRVFPPPDFDTALQRP
jgi:hypothetical protein